MKDYNYPIHKALNKLRDNILLKFPNVVNIAFCMPFSPLRGVVWRYLDKSSSTVLDVGPFWGSVGRLIRLREKRGHIIIGLDISTLYINHCKKTNYYNGLILADGRYLPFRNTILDTIIALEVIEHLTKKDGIIFLTDLERVNKRQILLSTPVGFRDMYHYHSESQLHLSGWYPIEFRKLGYYVRGIFGMRIFPKDLAFWVSYAFPIEFFFPQIAYNMLCIKNAIEPLP